MPPFACRRILVIGVTGSGKSRAARRLAARLHLAHIELDALFWKPGWVESDRKDFRARVELATRIPDWTLDGNYREVRDIVWPRAQAVVWLDYPLPLVFGQLWRRTWQRWRTQELLWGTNRERLFPQLKLWSKESLFNWLVRSYFRQRRDYPACFARPEYAHLHVLRFRRPRDMAAWEAGLAPA